MKKYVWAVIAGFMFSVTIALAIYIGSTLASTNTMQAVYNKVKWWLTVEPQYFEKCIKFKDVEGTDTTSKLHLYECDGQPVVLKLSE